MGVGNADVILITDLSGSMDWRLDSDETGIERNCDDPLLYDSSTKRISLAKCLDKKFVDIVLNASNNRVGLVGYSGKPNTIPTPNCNIIRSYHNLSTDNTSLKSQIEEYTPDGATGICGAIRQARIMLQQESNSSRQQFIVVMTDGLANVQCDPVNENQTTGCIPKICPGSSWLCVIWPWFCDDDYCYSVPGCVHQECGDWVGIRAGNDAVEDACRAHNYTNVTVYSIGFGPVSGCGLANQTLNDIANCGNGSYYSGTNATQLEEIYSRIAEEIVNVSYRAQTVELKNPSMDNVLYPDSYIELNYCLLYTSPSPRD